MHPEQRKIIEKDYNGPAKLSGVSGSGKTCIVVKRAIRLARKYPKQKILVLTLNKSLAKLIENLIVFACPEIGYRESITVQSFWKFCQAKLAEFEPHNQKPYDDLTWKTNEHIDDVWRQYYECGDNNQDAEILSSVHKALCS